MKDLAIKFAHAFLNLIIWTLAGLTIAFIIKVAPAVFKPIRQAHFPIFNEFAVDYVVNDNEYNHDIAGTFNKIEYVFAGLNYTDFCKFSHITADMKTPTGWERTGRVEFFDQPKNVPTNRKAGHQPYGVWKIKTSNYKDVSIVRLDVFHRCLWFYPAVTEVTINLDTQEVLE